MSAADLPGNNYNAPIGNEDMRFEQAVYREEFLERLRFVFGHPDFISNSSYGIVSEDDPASSTATSGPLWVEASTTDLTVSVTAGLALMKSGHWVYLETSQTAVGMSATESGSQNVVTLKFSTADPDERSPNEFGIPVFKRRLPQIDEDKVVVYSMSEWEALTAEQKDDHVPLALATVQTSGTSLVLSVTLANTSYTWLRPWFSPIDVKHRHMIGSGTVSSTNPHGISFNELTVGNFTLPMLTSHVGAVVAKDVSVPHVPGQVCEVDVPAGLIKTDDGSGSATGVPNTKYIDLDFYPIQIGAVYTQGDPDAQWAFRQMFRGQRIYQPAGVALVPSSTDLTVLAIKVETLEPPAVLTASTSQTKFTAGDFDQNDAVASSGRIYVSTMSMTLEDNMANDSGPIPLAYRFYFADGKIVRNPQVIVCSKKLTAITASGIVPTITQFDQGVILAALDGAAAGASLSVKIKITGTDPNGTAIEETLTFDSTWSQSTQQCSVNSGSFQKGDQIFAAINTVTLEENLNSGPNAAVTIWILMDPTTSMDLSYACPVANVVWDGTRMCYVEDLRPIQYDLQSPVDGDDMGIGSVIQHTLISEPSGTRNLKYLEAFTRPRYSSLLPTTGWVESAGGSWQTPSSIGRDRAIRTLDGAYETRAMALSTSAARVGIVFYPPLFAEWQRSAIVGLWYSVQSSAGTWASWTALTNSTNKIFNISLPANSRAIRIRVISSDLRGMALIEYTS